MNKWFRKALVVTFTILTFGMITPPPALTMQELKADEPPKRDISQPDISHYSFEEKSSVDPQSEFIKNAMNQAEIQSLKKFGSKIGPKIEDEFTSEILPEIEAVIAHVSKQVPEDSFINLVISEHPSGGVSEKIFHIYDQITGNDLIRFHVRRDHPPQEGYWFNFHYHTYLDGFQEHHDLGDIYWDKNTPPKWLS